MPSDSPDSYMMYINDIKDTYNLKMTETESDELIYEYECFVRSTMILDARASKRINELGGGFIKKISALDTPLGVSNNTHLYEGDTRNPW